MFLDFIANIVSCLQNQLEEAERWYLTVRDLQPDDSSVDHHYGKLREKLVETHILLLHETVHNFGF